jgi:hypothetical protein
MCKGENLHKKSEKMETAQTAIKCAIFFAQRKKICAKHRKKSKIGMYAPQKKMIKCFFYKS